MASQVAPGYNPEVSLLQGGNAPIVPVQGGGGMEAGAGLPPDYNPSNSLLNVGASAPIVPVKGGGQEGGDGKSAYEGFFLERYDPELGSIAIPRLSPEEQKDTLKARIQLYSRMFAPKILELKSFTVDPLEYKSTGIDNPSYRVCPTPGGLRNIPAGFFQRVRRYIVTITHDNPTIWILPNINGDTSKFLQYLNLITEADGKTKPGHFILFVGKFFSSNVDENKTLYIEFLKAKEKNPESLFQLLDLTPQFLSACCSLYRFIYTDTYLASEEMRNRQLAPFLEPDVVLFRNQHLLFKTTELPIQKDSVGVKVSEMLKKTPPEKYSKIAIVPRLDEQDDLPNHSGDAPAEQKYFTFDYNPALKKFITMPANLDIVCPTGKTCQGFKGGYALEKITVDDKKLPESGFYVIYKNTDKMPLLKEAGAVLTAENVAKLAPKPSAPLKIEEAAAKPLEEAVPSIVPVKEEEKEEPEIEITLKEKFVASPLATKALEERTIEINTFQFFIRYPLEDEVQRDWKEGRYTQSEVDFLNMLELTPTLVNKAFGKKNANQKIADFLQSIVLSNCFEDVSLLSKNECSNTHAFVKQIYFTKLRFLLESMYDDLGVLKPLSFLDTIALLKKLIQTKPILPIRLAKKHFRGDLFNPLRKLVFDPETGLYSIDFSTAANDLESKVQFYRIVSKDFDAVFQRMRQQFGKEEEEREEEPPPEEEASPEEDDTEYTFDELRRFNPPNDFFTVVNTAGDGLCFYRAVLKGKQEAPTANTKKPTVQYNPTKEESVAFIKQVRQELLRQRGTLQIGGVPVEEFFNEIYAPREGEARVLQPHANGTPFTEDEKRGRIEHKGTLLKMTFQEYLDLMNSDNPDDIPYADSDAGIGQIAAELKDAILIVYRKNPDGTYDYATKVFYYPPTYTNTSILPFSKVIFLENTGGNHYNLLKVKPGKKWPHIMIRVVGGGDEVFDLGLPLQRRFTRRNKKRNQK